jgi:hypothetical protein
MLRQIAKLTAVLALTSIVSADCILKNQLSDRHPAKETRSELCTVTKNKHYAFAMQLSEVVVPSGDGGSPWAGLVDANGFFVYDENCIPKGVYDTHQDSNCGIPYVIQDYWLRQKLEVTSVRMDLGAARFEFEYGGDDYGTGKGDCGCEKMSHDLTGEEGCRCDFPLAPKLEDTAILREPLSITGPIKHNS